MKKQEEKKSTDKINSDRPIFPKKAVITAGMPYGNKELHFGHIGGVFVHADTFARFLRDRIGTENVIFVSGTDCFGSPILESYRKLMEEKTEKAHNKTCMYNKTNIESETNIVNKTNIDNEINTNNETNKSNTGNDISIKTKNYENPSNVSIQDYVRKNHNLQKDTLDAYGISLNLYAASALDRPGEVHKQVSEEIFENLYKNGYIDKLSTPQFFDPEFKVLLNGRQVMGQCPIEGCSSDKAYADECSLGHQYMPNELLNPKSTLSGKTPEVLEVNNWYFKLEDYRDYLKELIKDLRENTNVRKYIINTMEEFLKPPYIYVKKSLIENITDLDKLLPKHELISEENKASVTFVFENLTDRDKAREVFTGKGIRFRTGKTLVPFRSSGNIEWGVKVPDKDNLNNLTFWVWPESLWAPISFTRAYLETKGKNNTEWINWWKGEDAKVYQFIGEDNIYFYGIAEMAIFAALEEKKDITKLNLPHLIANRHILFMDKKASSSDEIKPPMAKDLLQFYTPEQLRMHFLSLGLSTKSVSFKPMVYMPEKERNGADIVLKEGNLLTNVFNRLVRSCFYTSQNYFNSRIPLGDISLEIIKESEEAVLTYERHMYNHEFHSLTYVLDSYIRNMNKYWVNNMRIAETTNDNELRKKILIDSFHVVKTTAILLHPIAPFGTEMVRDYLCIDESLWNWDFIFSPIYELIEDYETHRLKLLEPKVDFFKKHESQLEL